MEYKYVIFSPYFGKLPCNFNLWLNSCSYNKKIKFIVFTDDQRKFNIPSNVEMVYLKFDEFVKKIQKKFKFKINIDNPYKLCDFKPTYGYVFDEYLNKCEYWGYCDLDIVFGDVCKYLPEEKYDKIAFLGHFCMYRNNKIINKMFMNTPANTIAYTDIFSSSQHFGFDEIGMYGINNIFKINNLTIFNYEINVADINCRKENLNIIKYENEKFVKEKINKIFVFENGKIYSIYFKNNKLLKKEYAYIHIQKRKMYNNVSNLDKFMITYKNFSDFIEINQENFSRFLPSILRVDFKWANFKIKAIKNRIKRFIKIKQILNERNQI